MEVHEREENKMKPQIPLDTYCKSRTLKSRYEPKSHSIGAFKSLSRHPSMHSMPIHRHCHFRTTQPHVVVPPKADINKKLFNIPLPTPTDIARTIPFNKNENTFPPHNTK